MARYIFNCKIEEFIETDSSPTIFNLKETIKISEFATTTIKNIIVQGTIHFLFLSIASFREVDHLAHNCYSSAVATVCII